MNWKKIITVVCIIACFVSVAASAHPKVLAAQPDADDMTGTGGLVIDNQNIYEGMENSYSGGYIPKTDGKKAVVVLPLLAKRKLAGNRMTVTLRFGETENLPFVKKNYEKAVYYGMYNTKNKTGKTGCYLVTFDLELKKDRYNGNYPVTLSVSAEDGAGNEISQEFTVYVIISDGKEADTQGADEGSAAGFAIDNKNVYEGMENSYSGGYTPKTDGKKAVVVLPLLAKRKLAENRVTVTLRFGESENLPFIQKNYEKAVSYGMHSTKNKTGKTGCYLVTFDLELKKDRYNGNYPVTLSVSAKDEAGKEISQEFIVYVTISDGKEAGTQGADGGGAAGFAIDNNNVYQGMGKSYSRGYTPKTAGAKAIIVLPLQAKRALAGKKLTAALKLGESGNQAFVQKNYEKTVRFGYHTVGKKAQSAKSGKKAGCYLVTFNLKLKKERYNGSYPVTISVSAQDRDGNEISQEFTVYVLITDGKGTEGDRDGDNDRTPSFAPKIMLTSCQFSEDRILCGEKYTAKIFLSNTSKNKAIKNMMITAAPGENIELLGKTNNTYVEELGSGRNCFVSFDFRVNAAAPAGQYSIDMTLDYADSSGNTYTVEESVKVSAEQKVRIGIDPVQVPREIQLGDTMILQTQAVNLGKGKLYNIRAVLEADGLAPVSSAYMGDAEAGTPLSGSLEVVAEGLSGDSLYGNTQGKVIFYYEDESGNEMTEVQDFETAILSPLKEDANEKPADNTNQWWVIMTVIAAFLGMAAVGFLVNKKRRVQRGVGELDEA